jgi:acetylornithine deacetylase/succinyl-diaminopimelate desuccinylase-like protein
VLPAAQLLELLEDWTTDPAVVLVAAPSLGRIVQSKPEPTLPALDTHDAISKLASIIKKQQQLSPPKVSLPSYMSIGNPHWGFYSLACS